MSTATITPCPRCGRVYTGGELFCSFDRTQLTPITSSADPLIDTIVHDRYTILERLGSGGMGVVYKALQNQLDRMVAVKVLSPTFSEEPTAAGRFRLEALAASRLTNGHTVVVHDFGEMENGSLFIVMQLLEGSTLRTRLNRGGLSTRAAVTIGMHIAESLAEAHTREPPIVHRDIKPDNIFVRDTSDGGVHATVLDFGLARFANAGQARLTSANAIIGTPMYMSPEQCRGEATVDTRADLYALGAILFEMLAGQPPFDAPDKLAILLKHVRESPPLLGSLRPDLEQVEPLQALVTELLAKSPEARPTAAVVRSRLAEIQLLLPRLEPVGATATNAQTTPARRVPLSPAPTSGPALQAPAIEALTELMPSPIAPTVILEAASVPDTVLMPAVAATVEIPRHAPPTAVMPRFRPEPPPKVVDPSSPSEILRVAGIRRERQWAVLALAALGGLMALSWFLLRPPEDAPQKPAPAPAAAEPARSAPPPEKSPSVMRAPEPPVPPAANTLPTPRKHRPVTPESPTTDELQKLHRL